MILPYLPYQLCDFGFNGSIIIEPTNECNLKCPLCPTSQNMKREKGFMRLKDFKVIIDENIDIFKNIYMNFAGEPLLNKNVFKMVKYAEEKGIKTMISTNTTLLHRYIDEILNSGLSSLIVCLDGATKDTHELYRVGSDFNKIKENIRKICEEKRKRDLIKPVISLQFIVMKQNEHEIERIIKLAKSLGVDKLVLKSVSLGSWVPINKKIELAKSYLPHQKRYSRYTVDDKGIPHIKAKVNVCPWIRQSVIYWNGDVTLCCYDYNGELIVGNVFDDGSFKKIWKSEKYKKYRKAVIRRELPLCKNCNLTSKYGTVIDFK